MKRLPDFGCQEFYIVTEDCVEGEEQWAIDFGYEVVAVDRWDDWLDHTLSYFDDNPPKFNKEYVKMANRKYMEAHVFGQPFEEWPAIFVDADCPKCKHLMVASDQENPDAGRFCSHCDFYDEKFKKFHEAEALQNKSTTMYLEGVNPVEYAKNLGISIHDMKNCSQCKRPVRPGRAFRTSNGYAGVDFDCSYCGNKMSSMITVTERAASFWNNFFL